MKYRHILSDFSPPASDFALKKLVAAMSCLLLFPTLASGDEEAESPALEEVVITGTLVRGTAPVGTNVIDMDPIQIAATGATSATELLQTLPQNASFNNLQISTGASFNVTINRPSLRDVPGGNSGGSPTLVLFDSRRIVGMGAASTTADPDIIPPALIERVEIVPDGGSALYGSDAVAGVINFITKKDFDGVEIEARYGNADNYDTFDGSITAGKSWKGGSAYIAYNHSENNVMAVGTLN